MMKYLLLMAFFLMISCDPLAKFPRPEANADEDVTVTDESVDESVDESDAGDEDIAGNDEAEDDSDIVVSDINGVVCTGQTKCYNEYLMTGCPSEQSDYFGTDGYYAAKGTCLQRNLAAVGPDPEKTVIDSNTGLEWIRNLSEDKFDWADAVKFCRDSEYAGFNDWRLPDHKELRTLVYYGKDASPAIEDDVFPSTPESFFWTSSVDITDSMNSWYVDFMYGTSGKMDKKGLNYVRCVRRNILPENSFAEKIVKNDKIISDQTTKLIWSSTVFPVKTWREALVYCKDLNYGGSAAWRLPSANELVSLVDIRERKPASLFPDLLFEKFWSSTTDSSYYSQFAVAVDFEDGGVAGEVKTDENYVICVSGENQEHDGKCTSDNGCPEGELCANGFCYGHDTECGIGDLCDDGYNCIKNKCYSQDAFVSTWSDNGTGITLPLVSSGLYDFIILWGDGTIDSIKTWNDPALTHTYKKEGDYIVQIIGTLIGWQFCDENQVAELCASSNSFRIKEIDQWGAMYLGLTKLQFAGCSNLDILALDVPDLTKTLDLSGAFAGCTTLTGGDSFKNWDVSQIRNMAGMFYKAENFNADISDWNVQYVESLSGMFMEARSFNNDISKWNTDSVYNMENMFQNAFSFNADISDWNVSDVISMKGMFHNAYSFNGDLSGWDVSNVTDMSNMFNSSPVNTDFSNWNVSNVTDMNGMFENVQDFNGNISNWDVSNVKDMSNMFFNDFVFNKNISNWNVSNVTNMSGMFSEANLFNQDISGWNVSSVTNMSYMFSNAVMFDQNISGWDVSNVTDMSGMFNECVNFDQDLSGWDVSNVTAMNGMFMAGTLSTPNYDAILNGWSELMLQNDVNFSGGNSKYSSSGEAARANIISDFNWTITDGGLE